MAWEIRETRRDVLYSGFFRFLFGVEIIFFFVRGIFNEKNKWLLCFS